MDKIEVLSEGARVTALRRVEMPSKAAMLLALAGCDAYQQSATSDTFFEIFADSIADSNRNALGLNMAWDIALYKFKERSPSFPDEIDAIVADINIHFDPVIDAITPDVEVAKQAKDVRVRFLEEQAR